MKNVNKNFIFDMEKYRIYNTSGSIDSKTFLTKEEILLTGDWYLSDYTEGMEGYFWAHNSIEDDGYTIYMRRYNNDGMTTITEMGREDNKLFEGYIKNLEELGYIVHLCRLYEI